MITRLAGVLPVLAVLAFGASTPVFAQAAPQEPQSGLSTQRDGATMAPTSQPSTMAMHHRRARHHSRAHHARHMRHPAMAPAGATTASPGGQ